MTQIILTEDQAKALQGATDAVEIRDRHGNLLGYVSPALSDAEIASHYVLGVPDEGTEITPIDPPPPVVFTETGLPAVQDVMAHFDFDGDE